MKKTIIRLICVALLIALFACALISCAGSGDGDGTTEPGTTAGEEVTTKKQIRPNVESKEPETTAEVETIEVDTSKVGVGVDSDEYGTAADMH